MLPRSPSVTPLYLNMYLYPFLATVTMAAAVPVDVVQRQLDRTGILENEFSLSRRCAQVVFVWARGSTELGNMVSFHAATSTC